MKTNLKRILSVICALALCLGMLPASALAVEGGQGQTKEVKTDAKSPVQITKSISEDGKKLTMEAYVTGEVQSSQKAVPLDVVLVLDQSGSMYGGNLQALKTAVTNFVGEIGIEANSFSSSANMTSLSSNKVVEATTLDNDIQEKITMIKMDIEGGEVNALLGAKKHIKQDLPKLFISVYHNNTHLFEIPKLIYSITHDYDFHLRYYGGCIYPTEIVLICLPKNS